MVSMAAVGYPGCRWHMAVAAQLAIALACGLRIWRCFRPPRAAPAPVRLLALGDCLTAGYGLPPGRRVPGPAAGGAGGARGSRAG